MFAIALLFIAVGVCIYLYARYRHICQEDEGRVYVEDTRSPDWKFPPKWHAPTAEAWSNKYERTP